MNATAKTIIESKRADGLWYDGPGELGRDSVVAVFDYLVPGVHRTMVGFFRYCGVQHNTASKAINILKHHGYDIRDRRIEHGDGKHHYEYWLVANETKKTTAERNTALSRGISAASRVLAEIEYSQSEDYAIEVLEKYLGLRPGANSGELYPFECRERQKLNDYLHQLKAKKKWHHEDE